MKINLFLDNKLLSYCLQSYCRDSYCLQKFTVLTTLSRQYHVYTEHNFAAYLGVKYTFFRNLVLSQQSKSFISRTT